MKGVTPIGIEKETAKAAWIEYKNALKNTKGNYIKEYGQLRQLYWHISQGKKVINILDCFSKAGYNEKGEPKLAIASVSNFKKNKEVTLGRNIRGYLCFRTNVWRETVSIPEGTMPVMSEEQKKGASSWGSLPELKARIPIIPPKYLPTARNLKSYYILWEVDNWQTVPKDPILLKKISETNFVVLAAWDLTPIERMIMKG